MRVYNTLVPYKVLDHRGIQYTTCREYEHISRYKGLRQVIHNPNDSDRFITLETPNAFQTNLEVQYYDVPSYEENRLDLIAQKFLGVATYSWVIAYFNDIDDGFTVREGTRLMIPSNITVLFNTGEILAPVSPLQLNLGYE